jgi:hypothetical protein
VADGRLFEVEWSRGPLPADIRRGAPLRLAPERFAIFGKSSGAGPV